MAIYNTVVYCRFPPTEPNPHLSLVHQEVSCEEDISGWDDILMVFREEGDSSNPMARPVIKEMLDFCRLHHEKIYRVLVLNKEIIADSPEEFHEVEAALGILGIRLLCRCSY